MYYLGVDLGGTNIAVGVVDEAGRILHKDSVPTGAGRPPQATLDDMAAICRKVVADAGITLDDIAAVGIGSPRLINVATGEVVFANNLYWHNVPLAGTIAKALGKPAFADNDANVAALAEVEAGSMKGAKNAVLLTLGTGVGGGIIIGGRIYAGTHNGGAELGHMCLVLNGEECTCGNRGCVERYTSATALIREGRKSAEAHPDGGIARKAGGNLEKINAKTVIDCAREGDAEAVRIFNEYIYALTMTIITVINIFEPEAIALGGGVSAAGDFFMEPLRKSVVDHLFYPDIPHPEIVVAELGNDAGIIGAAMNGKARLADN